MHHHEALHQFLTAHFSLFELRQLVVYLPHGNQLSARLPGGSVSPDEFAFEAVQLLGRHGALDLDFWTRLRQWRPHLASEIGAIRASFPALSRASSPTLSLVLARASAQERYTEIEFVVRNDSAGPQFIKELRLEAQNIVVDFTPTFTIRNELRNGIFSISLDNQGWGILVPKVVLEVTPTGPGVPATCMTDAVLSGTARALCELNMVHFFGDSSHDHANVHLFGHCQAPESGLNPDIDCRFIVRRSEIFTEGELPYMMPGPDTMYICLFDTNNLSCRKTYRILREVPPGQADIFICLVSADRSASFDLMVDLVSADDTLLSTRHENLTVRRTTDDSWQWKVKDGYVFTPDKDGAWTLNPVARRKPWDP